MNELMKSYKLFFDVVELVGLSMDEYPLHGLAKTYSDLLLSGHSYPDVHHENNFRAFVSVLKASTFPKNVQASKLPAARKKSFEKLLG